MNNINIIARVSSTRNSQEIHESTSKRTASVVSKRAPTAATIKSWKNHCGISRMLTVQWSIQHNVSGY